MTSTELLQHYALLINDKPANTIDIEVVADLVEDLCKRMTCLPNVSDIEPLMIVDIGGTHCEY